MVFILIDFFWGDEDDDSVSKRVEQQAYSLNCPNCGELSRLSGGDDDDESVSKCGFKTQLVKLTKKQKLFS